MPKDIYTSRYLYIHNKQVWISSHAIKQARVRRIDFPDHVHDVLRTGKMFRFGKHGVKFVKKSSTGSVICVGIDTGDTIVIKTIERGN